MNDTYYGVFVGLSLGCIVIVAVDLLLLQLRRRRERREQCLRAAARRTAMSGAVEVSPGEFMQSQEAKRFMASLQSAMRRKVMLGWCRQTLCYAARRVESPRGVEHDDDACSARFEALVERVRGNRPDDKFLSTPGDLDALVEATLREAHGMLREAGVLAEEPTP